ncbi:hypothetical protein C3400_25305 [Klebsiella oxytoca]|uniref:Uncharacterized protein n=1 Tax=Raoultella planticola TaxID=575 RepID=A0A443VSF6_RAOPL|nr:hypothetical protein C2U46_00040 [Klebsiella oxytoca]RWT25119.1 hypothetical protein DN603_03160 [Raoultella planticola]THE41010.1 hypothetical protein DJ495_14190 [Raoultella ornithinolytica]TXV08219.1 hypothetical protein D4M92_02560 [Klebsiella michiganensis]POT65794.1 hypothetical protein C3412_24675 [Klebsiella oxytoca]
MIKLNLCTIDVHPQNAYRWGNSLSILWRNMIAAARHPGEVLTQWHEAGGVLPTELARQLGVPANGSPRSSTTNVVLPATQHYSLLIGSAITRSSGCTCRHCTIWTLSKLNHEWLSDRSLLAQLFTVIRLTSI